MIIENENNCEHAFWWFFINKRKEVLSIMEVCCRFLLSKNAFLAMFNKLLFGLSLNL